jgi:hypothetical protein
VESEFHRQIIRGGGISQLSLEGYLGQFLNQHKIGEAIYENKTTFHFDILVFDFFILC